MSLAAAISERISDRLNPIVIKELRQAVQSRFVTVVMMIFLAIQVLVIGAFVVFDKSMATGFSSGVVVFSVLQGILVATCILFVPTYTGIRLAAERSRMDLMFITAIKPWSIVRGKFLAATVLTVLLFAVCMPFMTFTYLLRGIDLPSIFLIMAMGFLIVLAITQTAILWASIPGNLVVMIVLGILLAMWLVNWAFTIAIYLGMAAYAGIGSQMWTWMFWAIAGTVLFCGAVGLGHEMVLSVAMLSPPSANRMLPVRIYTTIIWLLSAVVAGIWAYVESAGEAIFVWMVSCVSMFGFMMLIAVCERDRWGPRVARKIPKNVLLRPLAFLFFTGWAGAVAWCVILMAITLIGGGIVMATVGSYVMATIGFSFHWDGFWPLVGLALYLYAYPMTALLLRRALFRNRIKSGLTWLIAVGLCVAATLLPVLVYVMIHFERMDHIGDEGLWLVGFPPMVFAGDQYLENCLWFAGTWSVVVFLLSLPWAVGRYMAFKPYRARPSQISQSAELPPEQAPAAPD